MGGNIYFKNKRDLCVIATNLIFFTLANSLLGKDNLKRNLKSTWASHLN